MASRTPSVRRTRPAPEHDLRLVVQARIEISAFEASHPQEARLLQRLKKEHRLEYEEWRQDRTRQILSIALTPNEAEGLRAYEDEMDRLRRRLLVLRRNASRGGRP